MSLRNLRKVQQAKSTQRPHSDSDDDFEPLCTRKTSKSTYEGLVLSSSDEENKVKEAALTDTDKEPDGEAEDSKPGCSQVDKKKKTKKQKKKKKSTAAGYLDEIDRSVSEVNALLGEPVQDNANDEYDTPADEDKIRLFTVRRRHLDSSNELLRLFGPDTDSEPKKRKGRRPNFKRIHSCKIIGKDYNFRKMGISMSIDRRDKEVTYFVYDHIVPYQDMHREFIAIMRLRHYNLLAPIEASLKNMHIEALIEASDMMFRIEDNTAANDIIEEAIAYLEYIAHPSFNILDLNTRLEYKFVENRAFHILILKYIHLLSNQACHRTALELAKVLINLDPEDPLAVVLIIDMLALRAKEYHWLVETIDYLDQDREAGYLFNMKFSKALANFFITTKEGRGDMSSCDQMLRHALLSYPYALREILDVASRKNEPVLAHKLFNDFAQRTTSKCLKELIHLYAAFTSTQWRDPRVLKWLIRNANEVAEENKVPDAFDEEKYQGLVVSFEGIRRYMFRKYPEQIQRHLAIIKSMNNLLVEGAVPDVTPITTPSFDPIPPSDGINRYDYGIQFNTRIYRVNSVLAEFFSSFNPYYDISSEGEYRTQSKKKLSPQTSVTSGMNQTVEEAQETSEKNDDSESSEESVTPPPDDDFINNNENRENEYGD